MQSLNAFAVQNPGLCKIIEFRQIMSLIIKFNMIGVVER